MNSLIIQKKGPIILMALVLLLVTACGQEPNSTATTAAPLEMETAAPDTPADENGPVSVASEGEVPFYARFSRSDIYHDGEWSVIIFYRPPDCVPENFNLLGFFDANAFACGPATTRSVELWENGPDVDTGPLQAEVEGRGSVPV
ncbi:MAG: hypothetical protein R3335_03300, partial [Anaerolineales bacterium]|nr:hypothetical protein [Anaerolineales bacterium]